MAALDDYLAELGRELRRHGIARSRIVEEVEGHVSEAAEAGERQGLARDAAVESALARFGPARSLAEQFAAERRRARQFVLAAVAVTLGVALGYVDSRPTWDDTGISAGLLLIGSFLLGAFGPERPWLWALCFGVWIPVFGFPGSLHVASLLVLAIAMVGAYGGMLARRVAVPR